jgi:hypothetical protein
MKQATSKPLGLKIFFFLTSFSIFLFFFLVFCSFTTTRLGDDFLKQLGLTKSSADERITSGILGGYVNVYGVKNAKNIALGDRKAVVLDLLAYTKTQAGGAAFLKKYNEMRDSYKPKEYIPETPEQDRAASIARAKDAVAQAEKTLTTAQPQYKKLFEESLKSAKDNLKSEEDPANRHQVLYAKNYQGLVKQMKDNYAQQLKEWEKKYPTNQLLYVKMRLQEFIDATKDIDYSAELTTKNSKKYFVNPAYERKDNRWKMAFRAGKEVVEPAREFVQKWMEEIK